VSRVLATLFGRYPFSKMLFADAGYQKPQFQQAPPDILPCIQAQIINKTLSSG
jgi:hypothetical protein